MRMTPVTRSIKVDNKSVDVELVVVVENDPDGVESFEPEDRARMVPDGDSMCVLITVEAFVWSTCYGRSALGAVGVLTATIQKDVQEAVEEHGLFEAALEDAVTNVKDRLRELRLGRITVELE